MSVVRDAWCVKFINTFCDNKYKDYIIGLTLLEEMRTYHEEWKVNRELN